MVISRDTSAMFPRFPPLLRISVLMVITVCFSLLVLDNIHNSAGPYYPDDASLPISDGRRILSMEPSEIAFVDGNTTVSPSATTDIPNAKLAVDPLNFHYIINPRNVCRGHNLSLIIYVHSAPANVKKRLAIRDSWGDQSLLKEFKARLVFVLGLDRETRVMDAIHLESSRYSDIIQENYVDSYRNLTLKAVSAIKWISNFCRNTEFILKTDDDILVNLFQLSRYMDAIRKNPKTAKGVMLCNLWTRMAVIRNEKSKWYVPKNEFPHDYFPPYCSGSAFLFTADVARTLYNVSFGTPFFWVDDYFLTGILMQKTNFKYLKLNKLYALNPQKVIEMFSTGKLENVMFSHVQGTTNMYLLWRALHKHYRGNKTTASLDWTEILKKQKGSVTTKNH